MSGRSEQAHILGEPGSAHSNYSSINAKPKDPHPGSANANKGLDVVVGLFRGHDQDEELDPTVANKLRSKLDWRILPLLCLLYTSQSLDKYSIGAIAILGIFEDAHLSRGQFNNIASAFHIGYIIFVWPHSWMMQHFPIGKYIAINVFLWSVFMSLFTVCSSYGGLFALRFLLGASEGCVTSGIMTILTMFYTRTEIGERINLTFQCNGIALFISSTLAFGISCLRETATKPHRWQWFMIIISAGGTLVSAAFWLWFPDSPAKADFLSDQEKVDAVNRIRSNQSGIESKVWKRYQFIEALKETKTWLFFFFAANANLQSGATVQTSIIIKALGFTTLQTTLLNFPLGLTVILSVSVATIALRRFPNSRSWIAAGGFIISIIACIFMIALPSSAQVGLLTALYMMSTSAGGFVIVISWVAVTTAGHTKKMTVNAIFMIGYAFGQILCTQFWKAEYAPRYIIPWIIQMHTYIFDIAFILLIRAHFNRENKRRDRVKAETDKVYEEFGYVETINADGTVEKFKVPIALLDITDQENEAFRYAL